MEGYPLRFIPLGMLKSILQRRKDGADEEGHVPCKKGNIKYGVKDIIVQGGYRLMYGGKKQKLNIQTKTNVVNK